MRMPLGKKVAEKQKVRLERKAMEQVLRMVEALVQAELRADIGDKTMVVEKETHATSTMGGTTSTTRRRDVGSALKLWNIKQEIAQLAIRAFKALGKEFQGKPEREGQDRTRIRMRTIITKASPKARASLTKLEKVLNLMFNNLMLQQLQLYSTTAATSGQQGAQQAMSTTSATPRGDTAVL